MQEFNMQGFMKLALEEAAKAKAKNEVPIGAVIVKDGQVVGRGHNLTETSKDATAHAEINAIKDAARNLGGWRLTGCHMYVTIEPCSMCAGALVWSRIERLYYGAKDPKAGGCGSVINVVNCQELNHQVEVYSGLLEEQCRSIVQEFFKELRNNKKKVKSEEVTKNE